MMKTWGGIIMAVLQLAIVAFAAPWAWKITNAVEKLSGDMQENRAWHTAAAEANLRDRENLRLTVLAEVEKAMRLLLEKAEGKQDRLSEDVRGTDREVRNIAAQMVALQDTVRAMAATVTRMQAQVTEALVSQDFRNNQAEKGK